MWRSGDHTVLCYYTGGRQSYIVPVTVVEDSASCIGLYLAAGTTIRRPVALDGSPIPRAIPYEERFVTPWKLGAGAWHTHDRLFLVRPGASHAISLFWDAATRDFVAWYVDLQAPLRRTDDGFASEDYVLDIVIAPDLTWHWKDEDEFEAAQRVGRFTRQQAADIRAEGDMVVETIGPASWPFDAGWDRWQPDESWSIPSLPEDAQ